MAGDSAKFAESVILCSQTLSMISLLSEEKDWLGRVKLRTDQKGWAFGFCDGWAQSIALADDSEFILFISLAFERTWHKHGLKFFDEILQSQAEFAEAIAAGGNAHHAWATTGKVPLMPR
jgi:hypothetical protein